MSIQRLSSLCLLLAFLNISACGGSSDSASASTATNVWADQKAGETSLIWDDGSASSNMKWEE